MAEIIRGVQMFRKLFRAVKGVLLKWIARGISRNDCVLGVRSLGKNSSRRWALREHLKGLGRSQVSKGMVRNRKRGELDEPSRPEVMVGGESELESQSRKTFLSQRNFFAFFKKLYFEIIMDSHAIVRNNPERSHIPLIQWMGVFISLYIQM